MIRVSRLNHNPASPDSVRDLGFRPCAACGDGSHYRAIRFGPVTGDPVIEDPRPQPKKGPPPDPYAQTYVRLCRSCRVELIRELLLTEPDLIEAVLTA